RVVDAADAFERVVVETLHAETDAVDAGVAIASERAVLDRAGIRLQRNLDVRRERESLRDAIENLRDAIGRKQARRAAAEKDALQRAAVRQRQILIEVGEQRRHVFGLRNR